MIIEITGRHVSVSESLKDHARDKLEHVLRHEDKVVSAHVILDVEKTRHIAEMIVYGRNLSATVHAESEDLHTSIDRCADKLRHHLAHHHGRRRDKKRKGESTLEAEAAALAQAMAAATEGNGPGEERAAEGPPPVTRTRLRTVAPMTLDAAAEAFAVGRREPLVFRDTSSSTVHVLYFRPDGSLGLIETGVG